MCLFDGTYLQLNECIHHDLSIVRMKEVLETACSGAEGSQQEGTVRDTLGPRGGHLHRVMGRDTGGDLASLRKGLGDDRISDSGGLLLVRGADPGKDDDLLDWTTILLVDLHNVEKPIDGEELGGGNAGDPGIVDGDRKVVRFDTPGETTNSYLAQHAHLAGNLGLQYHTDTDTFSVKDRRGQHCLNGVANGVTKIDEIA